MPRLSARECKVRHHRARLSFLFLFFSFADLPLTCTSLLFAPLTPRLAFNTCHVTFVSRCVVTLSPRPFITRRLVVSSLVSAQRVRAMPQPARSSFFFFFFFLSLIFLPNAHSFLPLRHLAFMLPLPRTSPLYHLCLALHRHLAPLSCVVPCVRHDAAASLFLPSFIFFLSFSFADLTLTPLLLAPATPRLHYMSCCLCHASRDRVVPCMSPQCFVCPSLPAKCVLLIRSFL